jgi:hypothetical protein
MTLTVCGTIHGAKTTQTDINISKEYRIPKTKNQPIMGLLI